jgi:hypothetical protein
VHLVHLRRPVVMCLDRRLLPLLQHVAHCFDLMRHCPQHVDHVVAEAVQGRIVVEGLAGGQEACQPGALQHAIVGAGLAAAFAKPSFAPVGCGGGQRLVVALAAILEVVHEVQHRLVVHSNGHDSHVLAADQH